jgi:hypothetical protein
MLNAQDNHPGIMEAVASKQSLPVDRAQKSRFDGCRIGLQEPV